MLSTPILAGTEQRVNSQLSCNIYIDYLLPLTGAIDFNSAKGLILPYLRTIDGLNTHDASYELAMAGGVTSAQVLPGSSNVIG